MYVMKVLQPQPTRDRLQQNSPEQPNILFPDEQCKFIWTHKEGRFEDNTSKNLKLKSIVFFFSEINFLIFHIW